MNASSQYPPPYPGNHRPQPGASGSGSLRGSGRPAGYSSGNAYAYNSRHGGHPVGQVYQQGPFVYLTTQYVNHAVETFVFDVRQNPVGGGAMGTVYKGVSMTDNSPVAIKQVNPQFASMPSVRQRARDEAALAFAHPNLIEMLACVESPGAGGPMFIISRFVNGMTLDKHVERNMSQFQGRDRQKRIIESLYPVCGALDYLHAKGVLHLDIKPSNIMIENGRTMRLMDLGIAFTPDQSELTGSGLLGTRGYAAPEQEIVAGQPLSFSPATDVYELAATMYELLTGHVYDPKNPEPVPNVPSATNQVLKYALAPDKDDRYQSACEFRSALEHSFLAPPPSPWKKIVAIVAAVVVAVVVLTAVVVMAVL